jgi:methionyl-tRNA formyltransferase
MRVVFAGTPEFAARARALLHAGPDHGLHVVAAYTSLIAPPVAA